MQNSARLPSLAVLPYTVRLVVNFIMAGFTQRNTVRYLETKIGVIGERFDVMCIQIAAARIATMLTSETIACKNVKSPALVFHRKAEPAPLNSLAIFVVAVCWSARRSLSILTTNCDALLNCQLSTFQVKVRLTFLGHALFVPCFIGMFMALEGRYAAPRAFAFLHADTGLAAGGQPIPPVAIDVKRGAWLPSFAAVAPLQANVKLRRVLIQSQAQPTSSDFQYT